MDLSDFLGPKPIVVALKADNRWDAIDELINQLVAKKRIKAADQEAIVEAVKKREAAMSTGIGFGVGLPHTKTDLVSEVVVAVGRSRDGLEFEALDRKPVNLVMLFLVPEGQFQKYLNTLANLAKLLHRQDFRDELWRRFE